MDGEEFLCVLQCESIRYSVASARLPVSSKSIKLSLCLSSEVRSGLSFVMQMMK